MSEKLNLPPVPEDGATNSSTEIEPIPENFIYDFNPALRLKQKDADLSYTYMGSRRERIKDVYEDQNGSQWIEIDRLPRSQMAISLLAQPFFNISPVIEVPTATKKISNYFSRLIPGSGKILESAAITAGKKTSVFSSKVLDLKKVEQKTSGEMIADYIVFTSIFEGGGYDRSLAEKHNFRREGAGYAMFDFEAGLPLPFKDFANSKTKKWKTHEIKDGMTNFFTKVKQMLSVGVRDEHYIEKEVPISIVRSVVHKLKEVKTFFTGEKGELFYKAVLEKTKFKEEYLQEHEKRIKNADKFAPGHYLYWGDDGIPVGKTKKELREIQPDTSYYDPHELTLGLLAQIFYTSNVLLDVLKKNEYRYSEQKKEYDEIVKELEDVVCSGNDLFVQEIAKIKHSDAPRK